MDSPQRISIKEPQVILSPCSSARRRRRTSTCSNSPEFEFWMVRNPSFPQPNLVSADELFVDGVLLPLHLLHQPNNNTNNSHPDPDPDSPEPEPPNAQPDPGPEISPASITIEPTSSSKRWKDMIFKKGDKKTSTAAKKQEEKDKDRDRDKKREKRSQSGASSAELNIINIWPFSRSRSAGNSVTRPKLFPGAPGTRKVSSAPCSRSNSAGESKSRKSWPSSPSRPGVHVGRSSPVWQARRGGSSGMKSSFPEAVVRSGEKLSSKKEVTEPGRGKNIASGNGSTRAKVLNINVPVCIGYRNHLSCRSDENSAIGARGSGGGKNVAGGSTDGSSATNSTINVGNGGNLFNFRSLFSKQRLKQEAMAVFSRFARATRSWRTIPSSSLRTLNPSRATSCDLPPPTPLFLRSFNHQIHSSSSEILRPRWASNANELPNSLFPALLASFIGVGMLQVAHADSDENASKPPLPSESSPSSYGDLEEIAKKERQRIEELLKSKGIKYGSFPRFTIAVKGQKVTIKFQIPPACDTPQLIANLVSNLGVKVDERGAGSDMSLRAWDSAVAWQLTLNYPEKQKEISGERGHSGDMKVPEGDLCILLFRSLISSDKPEVEFIKSGSLSTTELDAFVSVLQLAGSKLRPLDRKPAEGSARVPSADKSVASLESMGVRIYGLDEPLVNSSSNDISWENIAGYDQQKREIEDTILLALQSPEVYDDIARGTRRKFESNRPRAVLFEGPPGTGKTSCARVIATQAGVPLLYLPLEVVMSKYYGESERLLGKVFTLANEIPNGAIIFLDEVDSFAAARDSEMHEATRRILSVLLRQIDGFEQDKKVVVIAATNRKQDLDPALISRFDSMITFGLPDRQNRQEIAAQYAKHLTESELEEFARVTEDMSGRDIRDVCQQAERSWASKIIRGQASKDGGQGNLPPLAEYTESAMNRRKALASIAEQKSQGSIMRPQKPQLDTC